MNYLVVDACLGGTGVRDAIKGGYLSLETLKLDANVVHEIGEWLGAYADAHYEGFSDTQKINQLDKTGVDLTNRLKLLLAPCKIAYYSSAHNKTLLYPI